MLHEAVHDSLTGACTNASVRTGLALRGDGPRIGRRAVEHFLNRHRQSSKSFLQCVVRLVEATALLLTVARVAEHLAARILLREWAGDQLRSFCFPSRAHRSLPRSLEAPERSLARPIKIAGPGGSVLTGSLGIDVMTAGSGTPDLYKEGEIAMYTAPSAAAPTASRFQPRHAGPDRTIASRGKRPAQGARKDQIGCSISPFIIFFFPPGA